MIRQGVRLGVDVGSVRIGIARCDPCGILASPLETVRRGAGDLDRIAALCTEHEVMEVIVGLPTSLSGREGPAALAARDFASELATRLPALAVRLFDERLTTVTAQAGLRAGGKNSRKSRAVVDQAAATVLLQSALDLERSTGNAPGEMIRGSS